MHKMRKSHRKAQKIPEKRPRWRRYLIAGALIGAATVMLSQSLKTEERPELQTRQVEHHRLETVERIERKEDKSAIENFFERFSIPASELITEIKVDCCHILVFNETSTVIKRLKVREIAWGTANALYRDLEGQLHGLAVVKLPNDEEMDANRNGTRSQVLRASLRKELSDMEMKDFSRDQIVEKIRQSIPGNEMERYISEMIALGEILKYYFYEKNGPEMTRRTVFVDSAVHEAVHCAHMKYDYEHGINPFARTDEKVAAGERLAYLAEAAYGIRPSFSLTFLLEDAITERMEGGDGPANALIAGLLRRLSLSRPLDIFVKGEDEIRQASLDVLNYETISQYRMEAGYIIPAKDFEEIRKAGEMFFDNVLHGNR
ncbi:MAG: hypothetical protein V1861_00885 [Candidatus Micrarchaeota archaeon]